jgi:pimeloyl-ACP methyl ester carboxylesterase
VAAVRTVAIFLGSAILLLLLIAFAGYLYNRAAQQHSRLLSPPPGEFFFVDGRAMHLYCTGTGWPTVVIESGLGDTWLTWQLVQPGLAAVTKVCTYDRAGLGWSDPDSGRRDAVAIADQLHKLLEAAGVTDRLLLVGHSAGGLFVRQFAAKYPENVVGLVMVDATPAESFDRIASARETPAARKQRHREAFYRRFKDAIGVSRLQRRCQGRVPPPLAAFRRYARAAACRPQFATSWLREVDEFEMSAREVAGTTFGALPLVVISQDSDRPKAGWSAEDIAANPIWAELQENLKKLSTNSRRVIARGSGHGVQIDRPDVVVKEIERMVLEIRGNIAPSDQEATTIE